MFTQVANQNATGRQSATRGPRPPPLPSASSNRLQCMKLRLEGACVFHGNVEEVGHADCSVNFISAIFFFLALAFFFLVLSNAMRPATGHENG